MIADNLWELAGRLYAARAITLTGEPEVKLNTGLLIADAGLGDAIAEAMVEAMLTHATRLADDRPVAIVTVCEKFRRFARTRIMPRLIDAGRVARDLQHISQCRCVLVCGTFGAETLVGVQSLAVTGAALDELGEVAGFGAQGKQRVYDATCDVNGSRGLANPFCSTLLPWEVYGAVAYRRGH